MKRWEGGLQSAPGFSLAFGGAKAPRGLKPALLFLLALAPVHAAPISADSTRGAAVFQTLSCIQCHLINGKGGTTAPDLGRRIDRDFTPASLAGTMWNHAPVMWAAMREQNVRAGDLNEQAANDLFAYFYSVRFFEKPGDAGRGKNLFASKHCADCHGLTQPKFEEAKPVSRWESVGGPIYLIAAMWSHVGAMRQEFQLHGLKWSELTPQDLADMLVYLRGLPEQLVAESPFFIDTGANGQALFSSKGCAACHTGKLDLVPLLRGMTLTDIAADMWNHEPRMGSNAPQVSADEMRELLSYLWARQFFEGEGNASAGARVFASKHCGACHNDPSSGAPKLTRGGEFTAATMVSALWRHGPRMLDQMKSKGISWPRFSGTEMANLIAYLNKGK